ncbi:PilN domain-containing protein [Enterobacter soli]|uniref:PilN domain-containing protein n=1 Tax=Enterobacter soli TaxID=885040 RepID=UPI0034CFABBD
MSRVNLLPWRQQRRARCLRVWCLLLAGWLLVTFVLALGVRAHQRLSMRGLELELTGINAVQRALEARRRQTASITAQSPAAPLWHPALESLAQAMPPQAWLTRLRYQASTLTLTGYAATLPALTAMADALPRVTGMTPGAAGELQQDDQGRWMFTFRLKRQG